MKFTNTTLVLLLVALFSLSSCGGSAKKVQGENDIKPATFKKMMDANEFVAIDVRKFKERYDDNVYPDLNRPYGCIPNTPLNIDWESGDFKNEVAKLDKNKAYGLYCRSGNRSGKALKAMKSMGFKNVNNLFGGMKAWLKAGLPNEVVPTPAK